MARAPAPRPFIAIGRRNKDMDETIGRITIAPRVLVTVVRYATLAQPGVARLSEEVPPRPARFRGKAATSPGIAVLVDKGWVTAEIHVIADGTVNARVLGENLQRTVRNALEDIVGMPVNAVHVYIDNVDTLPQMPS